MLRNIALLILASLAVPAFAQANDALQAAYRLAGAGAPELALKRVEDLQPSKHGDARWADWEILRLNLLAQLGRNAEILLRVEKLPSDVPVHVMRRALFLGGRAALMAGNPPLARRHLARLLWQFGTLDEEYRLARQLTIESYLAEKKAREAYLAMLRFEQDFKPLSRELAQRFARGLVLQGMEKEAAPWLAYLDDANPVKLLARLKAGLMAPEAAVAQARTAMKKATLPGHWLVLKQAGIMQNNPALRLEAEEQLANLENPGEEGIQASAAAADLWQSYRRAAETLANQNHLLVGDDANWLELASRLHVSSPPLGRALLAHLSTQGNALGSREQALTQLVASLRGGKLGRTAARLFADPSRGLDHALSPETPYALGAVAAEGGEAGLAARLWKGLPAPQGVAPEEWQLRLAAALMRAGRNDEAAEALLQLATGKERLAADIAQRALDLGRDLARSHPAAAARAFAGLAPAVEPMQRREFLYSLGRAMEFVNDPRRAADYFLQAAILVEAKSTDGLAQAARMQAASNLARAGLGEEARVQYQWLLQATKDKARQEAIRRELRHLP